jgi:hypothetical protein
MTGSTRRIQIPPFDSALLVMAAISTLWLAFDHWSLFNLRFPQCVSLRDESNVRTTFGFNALAMRPNITGPLSLTTKSSASTAFCLSSRLLLDLRQLLDISGGVFEGDQLAIARQRNRFLECSLPAGISHRHAATVVATAYACPHQTAGISPP